MPGLGKLAKVVGAATGPLDQLAVLIDTGHDQHAAAANAREVIEGVEPDQLQRNLYEHARRVASPVIGLTVEARVLAVPITEADIHAARTDAERELLIDLGPPPWFVYRIRFHTAKALQTLEPGGVTRWRF